MSGAPHTSQAACEWVIGDPGIGSADGCLRPWGPCRLGASGPVCGESPLPGLTVCAPMVAPGEGEEPALGELTAPFAFQPEEHTAGPRSRRSEVFTASVCGVCPLVPAWPGALNPGEPCSASWAIDQSTASGCSAGSFRGSALEFPAACSPHWARGCGCSLRAPEEFPREQGWGRRWGEEGGRCSLETCFYLLFLSFSVRLSAWRPFGLW